MLTDTLPTKRSFKRIAAESRFRYVVSRGDYYKYTFLAKVFVILIERDRER